MSSAARKPVERYPWEPESATRANLAAAKLRTLLQSKTPPRDAQTLLIAAGALAGFAGQNAALEQGELLTSRRDLVAPESLMLKTNRQGQRFLFGRWVNAPLLLGYGHGFPLQRFVVQAAAAAGLRRDQFPDFWELERRIGKAAGKADGDFGRLEEVEGRGAPARPQDLLRALWPTARRVFMAPMPLEMADEPAMNEAHWPILMGLVTARAIGMTREAVDPARAAGLVMESAIIASKLDPDLVDPGRWRLAPGARGLQIVRDDRRRHRAA